MYDQCIFTHMYFTLLATKSSTLLILNEVILGYRPHLLN